MIKLKINKLRSFTKVRNTSGYKNMSKDQLINLLTKLILEFINKSSKKQLIAYVFYNYGNYFLKLKMNFTILNIANKLRKCAIHKYIHI